MSEELAVLYQVQQADTEIARLREALAALDTGASLEMELATAEAELAAVRARHHATERESLDCDLELKTLEEKRSKFQTQLYGGSVRNPRQLEDLQREVAMLSREIGKVEDRALELMELLESQRAEIAQKEAQLAELRRRLEAVHEKYETTSSWLHSEIRELEARREELAGRVPALLLRRYEQIRARQSNLGLVKVTGGTCPGCRIALPSDTLKSLKAGAGRQTCENCGRLLFWEGEPERA